MEIKHPTTEITHIVLDLPEWNLFIDCIRNYSGEIPHFQVSDARLISESKVTLYVKNSDMDKLNVILKGVSV